MVHRGLHASCRRADQAVVRGDTPPTNQRQPLLAHDHREDQLREQARLLVGGAKEQPDGVAARLRELHHRALVGTLDATQRGLPREELVRDLHQHTRAVASVGLRARGAAVGEALERGQPEVDHLVAGEPLLVSEKADTTSVTLVLEVDQSGQGVMRLH